VNSKTLFALAVLCLVSGCQPKDPATHDCACLCYKDTGTTVYQTNVTVTTTQECGNVNGGACSWDSGGQHIDGKYANCGPNPNVSKEGPMTPTVRWLVGFSVSLGLGWLFVGLFLRWVQHDEAEKSSSGATRVPPWFTGLVERTFFTIVIAFDISGAATGMMAWLAVKMASNWNRVIGSQAAAFQALTAGLISLFFALVGGLICRGRLLGQ